MSAWQKVRIGDICKITSSKRIYASDYKDKGVPFYRSKEIIEKQKGCTEVSTKLFISEKKYGKIKNKFGVPEAGDLLLTSVGTLGIPYIVKQGERFYFKDGNLTWFREFEGISSEFLYYWLLSSLGRAELKRCTIGASQPAFTIAFLVNMDIILPSLKSQSRISGILSAYDDLIENNLRRIKILEEMAQALYREWFVHFRFPGHEKVRLVDSPLGKIPEGWEASTLGDNIVALESGRRPKGGVTGIAEGIPSIGAENVIGIGKHDFSKERYVPHEFFDSLNKGVVKDGEVALYKDGANIGRSTYFRDGYPYQKCCVNEHVFLIRATGDHLTQNMLYLWLREPETVAQIRSKNTNAAQPGINQKAVRSLRIVVPPKYVVNEFDSLVESILGEIVYLANKNRVLQCTRDLLLPKLISGELDVSELDIALPEDI